MVPQMEKPPVPTMGTEGSLANFQLQSLQWGRSALDRSHHPLIAISDCISFETSCKASRIFFLRRADISSSTVTWRMSRVTVDSKSSGGRATIGRGISEVVIRIPAARPSTTRHEQTSLEITVGD